MALLVILAVLFLVLRAKGENGAQRSDAPYQIRWAALSMQETGDLDRAIGPQGEVSRFAIMPALWARFARAGDSPTNQWQALGVAMRIQALRAGDFARRCGRLPNDLEWVLLWKCPGHLLRNIQHPTSNAQHPGKWQQARLVVNLMGRPQIAQRGADCGNKSAGIGEICGGSK